MWVEKTQSEIEAQKKRQRLERVRSFVVLAGFLAAGFAVFPPVRGLGVAGLVAYGTMRAIMVVLQKRAEEHTVASYLCPGCGRTSTQIGTRGRPVACDCGGQAIPVQRLKWIEPSP